MNCKMYDLLEEEFDYKRKFNVESNRTDEKRCSEKYQRISNAYDTDETSVMTEEVTVASEDQDNEAKGITNYLSSSENYKKMSNTSDTDETSVMTEELFVASEDEDNEGKRTPADSSSSYSLLSKTKSNDEPIIIDDTNQTTQTTKILKNHPYEGDKKLCQNKEIFNSPIKPVILDLFHQISKLDQQLNFSEEGTTRSSQDSLDIEEASGIIDLYEDNMCYPINNVVKEMDDTPLEENFIDSKIKPILLDISNELSNLEKFFSSEGSSDQTVDSEDRGDFSGIESTSAELELSGYEYNECACKSTMIDFDIEHSILDTVYCVCSISQDDRQSCHLQLQL